MPPTNGPRRLVADPGGLAARTSMAHQTSTSHSHQLQSVVEVPQWTSGVARALGDATEAEQH